MAQLSPTPGSFDPKKHNPDGDQDIRKTESGQNVSSDPMESPSETPEDPKTYRKDPEVKEPQLPHQPDHYEVDQNEAHRQMP